MVSEECGVEKVERKEREKKGPRELFMLTKEKK